MPVADTEHLEHERPWSNGPWTWEVDGLRKPSGRACIDALALNDADGNDVLERSSPDGEIAVWKADADLIELAPEMAEAILAWDAADPTDPTRHEYGRRLGDLRQLAGKLEAIRGN